MRAKCARCVESLPLFQFWLQTHSLLCLNSAWLTRNDDSASPCGTSRRILVGSGSLVHPMTDSRVSLPPLPSLTSLEALGLYCTGALLTALLALQPAEHYTRTDNANCVRNSCIVSLHYVQSPPVVTRIPLAARYWAIATLHHHQLFNHLQLPDRKFTDCCMQLTCSAWAFTKLRVQVK